MSDDRERVRPDGSWSQSLEAKLAPNVKPKLSQKEGNNKGDHWNKERPTKVRRSRSTDSQRVGRGRRTEREKHQGERRKRGRSEEARKRDRREGESTWRKKKPPEDDDVEECAVCFCSYNNIFKTPKLLACGHTFCLECLARINVTSPELKTLSCPICREVTELPHGQDLPRLGNNEDIISKLPPDMQRALSIRFKRSKGKLLLKSPPPNSPTKPNVVNLPMKTPDVQVSAGGDLHLSEIEQGIAPTTVVDVGRPPNRVRGSLRGMFRSAQCYYAVVVTIIIVAVVLLLVAILSFVILPNLISGGNNGIKPGRP